MNKQEKPTNHRAFPRPTFAAIIWKLPCVRFQALENFTLEEDLLVYYEGIWRVTYHSYRIIMLRVGDQDRKE